jgi:hypothetical protein
MMDQMTVAGADQLNDPKSEASMMQEYLDFDAPFSIQLPDRLKKWRQAMSLVSPVHVF